MKSSVAIQAMILPTIEALGYELWGCTYLTQGRHSILRIYIDNEKEGITLADCERVSRHISALLDVENPILGHYSLEVSSPGLDRPLFTEKQFQRFIGYDVAIHTHSPIESRRRFKGLLKSTTKVGVVLDGEEGELILMWDNIMRANILPEMNK